MNHLEKKIKPFLWFARTVKTILYLELETMGKGKFLIEKQVVFLREYIIVGESEKLGIKPM